MKTNYNYNDDNNSKIDLVSVGKFSRRVPVPDTGKAVNN